ncbi:MAG: response regulator [Salinirussus sp.]
MDPIRVLVVDEDEEVLDLTATFLERESDRIEAVTEADPEAAAGRADTEDVDAVVSDYRMPRVDGLDLCAAVRDDDPDLPFFLFTGSTDDETQAEAEAAGVTGLVGKGAGTDHYVDLVERIEAAV